MWAQSVLYALKMCVSTRVQNPAVSRHFCPLVSDRATVTTRVSQRRHRAMDWVGLRLMPWLQRLLLRLLLQLWLRLRLGLRLQVALLLSAKVRAQAHHKVHRRV